MELSVEKKEKLERVVSAFRSRLHKAAMRQSSDIMVYRCPMANGGVRGFSEHKEQGLITVKL